MKREYLEKKISKNLKKWLELKELHYVTDFIQEAVWEPGYLKNESDDSKNKIIEYAKEAAGLGSVIAMNQLGAIYNEGLITNKDINESFL